jgi:hypothetical protein
MSQMASGTFCRGLHAGSVEGRALGFRVPQQNAIIRSDPGSSGECRLNSTWHPTILIESEERHMQAVKETTSLLCKLEYHGLFLDAGRPKRIEFFDPTFHQRLENAGKAARATEAVFINNLLFIHESKRNNAAQHSQQIPLGQPVYRPTRYNGFHPTQSVADEVGVGKLAIAWRLHLPAHNAAHR